MTDPSTLLHLLHLATDQGRAEWTEVAPDSYEARVGHVSASFELRYPMMGDETVSGADCVQASIRLADQGAVVFTWFSGSEPFEDVMRLLARAVRARAEWRRATGERMGEIASALERAIAAGR